MKKLVPLITGINFIILIVLINVLLGFAPNYRLDLTKAHIHSLSAVSQKTIKDLDDLVTIKVFMTGDLPSEVKPIAQDLKTILNEMSLVNRSRLKVEYLDPSTSDDIKSQATKYGIAPLQFSTVKNDKFEVQNGYLGLALTYGERSQVLPVAGDVGNLEYFLVSGIKKLTTNKTYSVALDEGLNTNGQTQLQYLRKYLQNTYEVIDTKVNSDEKLPEQADMLLVAGAKDKLSDKAKTKIEEWVKAGKGLILLIDKVMVTDSMQGQKTGDLGWDQILKESGMEIEEKLVLDQSSSIANFRTQSGTFLTQYPYWVTIRPENINYSLPVMSGINSLTLDWSSPIKTEGEAKVLFTSTNNSNSSDNFSDLTPISKEKISGDNGGKYVLGAINTTDRKVALVADGDFIRDQFVANSQQNMALVLNLVDYFSQDASMLSIRSKSLAAYPISQVSDNQKKIIRYINLTSPLMILLITAVAGNIIRNKKNKKWNQDEI